jgi:hypothetical protein
MPNPKQAFLRDQAFLSAVIASLQRASIYSSRTSDLDRRVLGKALRAILMEIAEQYTTPVSEEAHVKNIVRLADTISAKCGAFLVNGRLRIGIAQKALNLYLKYLWCLEQIPTPPHCPFDSRIMTQLPQNVQVSWTRLDDISTYLDLVVAAKRVAAGQSLAEWDLHVYQGA